jgi:putative ABC transport system permease protein
MIGPRWKKLLRDLQIAQGRILMMVLAIAVGVFSVGTIMSAYTILTREISRNYLDTNPASALLELEPGVDEALLAEASQQPGVEAVEASSTVLARVEVSPNQWMPLLLFVIQDFDRMQINTFKPESGEWPPAQGHILLEREALTLIRAQVGEAINVETPNGSTQAVLISGLVHDPGLAPAWQEQTSYGYITPATLALLDGSGDLHILKVVTQDQSSVQAIEAQVSELAIWLKGKGYSAEEIRIPPPGKHPHQTQMVAILVMMLIFSLMALVLSAVLTATMVGGLLAQQVRQIGVMKAIGARSLQIAGIYLVLVVFIGSAAVLLGLPPSLAAGRGLAGLVAGLLNFTLYSADIPAWVYLVQFLAGVLMPFLLALGPIFKATRVTVRETINDFGTSKETFGSRRLDSWLGKIQGFDSTLMLALRNTFRRRGRLLLTLSLLSVAGGVFLAALNVKTAWERNLAEAATDRRYDLEIRLNSFAPEEQVLAAIAEIPGIQKVEMWNHEPAAKYRPDGLDIVRTYPDGGHGSFTLRSLPPETDLVNLIVLDGRWLQPGATEGVVLNHMARALFPGIKAGDPIQLMLDGKEVNLRVVGIVRELITPATAYITPEKFAQVTGMNARANGIRIVMDKHDAQTRSTIAGEAERRLEQNGMNVKVSILETMLDAAVSGHVYILIVMLILMSVLIAIVGALGLVSSMGTSVIERTREFGIMRSIGARSRTVLWNVISEGIFIGLMSWVIAVVLSLPLSLMIGRLVGNLAFRFPLPLVLSPSAVIIWLAIIVVGSVAASAYPARNASRLTIRETLVYI